MIIAGARDFYCGGIFIALLPAKFLYLIIDDGFNILGKHLRPAGNLVIIGYDNIWAPAVNFWKRVGSSLFHNMGGKARHEPADFLFPLPGQMREGNHHRRQGGRVCK